MRLHRVRVPIHRNVLMRISDRHRPISVINLDGAPKLKLRCLLSRLDRSHLLTGALACVLSLLLGILMLDDSCLSLRNDDLLVLIILDDRSR